METIKEKEIGARSVDEIISKFVELVDKGFIDDIEKCCAGELTKKDIYVKYIDDIMEGDLDEENLDKEISCEETETKNVQWKENEYKVTEIMLKDIYRKLAEISRDNKDIKLRITKLERANNIKKAGGLVPYTYPYEYPKVYPKDEKSTERGRYDKESGKVYTGGEYKRKLITLANGAEVSVDFSDFVKTWDKLEAEIKRRNAENEKEKPVKKFDKAKIEEAFKKINEYGKAHPPQWETQLIPGKRRVGCFEITVGRE